MNPAIDAQTHPLGSTVPCCGFSNPTDFDDAVDNDGADARAHGTVDLGKTLVVAVESQSRRINASRERNRHLPCGGNIDVEACGCHPAGNLGAQECFARVVHLDAGADASELAIECCLDFGGAVSYTHLRAHETDSYLVCRLLLEKKKN